MRAMKSTAQRPHGKGKLFMIASTTFHSAQRGSFHLKHKRVVFVTTRFVESGQPPRPTQPFSFPSLFRQLHDLHRIHTWDRQCAEGALNRNWSRQSDYEAAGHRARGAYCGGSSSVCALDVGALIFLLNYVRAGSSCPYGFPIERADYSGRLQGRQGKGINPIGMEQALKYPTSE